VRFHHARRPCVSEVRSTVTIVLRSSCVSADQRPIAKGLFAAPICAHRVGSLAERLRLGVAVGGGVEIVDGVGVEPSARAPVQRLLHGRPPVCWSLDVGRGGGNVEGACAGDEGGFICMRISSGYREPCGENNEGFELTGTSFWGGREQAVMMEGFSPASPPRIFWNSRKRSGEAKILISREHIAWSLLLCRNLLMAQEEVLTCDRNLLTAAARSLEDAAVRAVGRAKEPGRTERAHRDAAEEHRPEEEEEKVGKAGGLSERRRALFEPLEPSSYGHRTPADVLLPPPDFDPTCYPKGWLVGKKRKLVNVDVVESMRRIAIQEMNRKDKEIDGLNEQLEEDARCLEHLQLQLLQERSKRVEAERQNAMLQDQVSMLMNVLEETHAVEEEEASGDH
ncbi:hypothetical protein GW17_00016361, partial [Ensete ventricosum]